MEVEYLPSVVDLGLSFIVNIIIFNISQVSNSSSDEICAATLCLVCGLECQENFSQCSYFTFQPTVYNCATSGISLHGLVSPSAVEVS